jgi:flagellar basal body-associated protein FliL
MFRVLGILIVALIVIVVVAALVNSKVVRPARNQRHIAELEAENERLDALLHNQARKETHA